MDNKDYLINVIALSESFLLNDKKKLEGINDLKIRKTSKDGTYVDINITKDKFISSMVDIFKEPTNHLSEVSVYYIVNGVSTYLNGISIF